MGLYKPSNSKNWYIKTTIKYDTKTAKLRESTGTPDKRLAQKIMNKRISDEMDRLIYGARYPFTFEDGAVQLLKTVGEKRRIGLIPYLDELMPMFKDVLLSELHNEHPLIIAFKEKKAGCKNNTINKYLETIGTIVRRAGTLWIHDGQTWTPNAPRIVKLPLTDLSGGYPLSLSQQREFFKRLPAHYYKLATVAINCGARAGELLSLKWSYERVINGISLFMIPTSKNGQPRLILMNSDARRIIDKCRGEHPEYVFSYFGKKLTVVTNAKGWRLARSAAGLDNVRGKSQHFRFHDLRHTCATRLRECGVGKEDRADILGHKSKDITTHYSSGEVMHLVECVERLVTVSEKPTLYLATA